MGNWWRWLRQVRQHPIYLREKGHWGNPNPYYATLSRYSPFLIMGAIVLGLCAGSSNLPLFAGIDEELMLFWCLLCLPGALLSMLTIFGLFAAPALTAPSVSLEMDRGSWDMLRVTPYSTGSILLAKLFGALSRLRIWPALFVLSLFQGAIVALITVLGSGALGWWGILFGVSTLLRPWLEILFAAFVGMYVSTWVRSATMALVGSYALILVVRVLNSSGVWLLIATTLQGETGQLVVSATAVPVIIYTLLLVLLAIGIVRRAENIGS